MFNKIGVGLALEPLLHGLMCLAVEYVKLVGQEPRTWGALSPYHDFPKVHHAR
jgi:hypothetical protein